MLVSPPQKIKPTLPFTTRALLKARKRASDAAGLLALAASPPPSPAVADGAADPFGGLLVVQPSFKMPRSQSNARMEGDASAALDALLGSERRLKPAPAGSSKAPPPGADTNAEELKEAGAEASARRSGRDAALLLDHDRVAYVSRGNARGSTRSPLGRRYTTSAGPRRDDGAGPEQPGSPHTPGGGRPATATPKATATRAALAAEDVVRETAKRKASVYANKDEAFGARGGP